MLKIGKDELTELLQDAIDRIADLESDEGYPKGITRRKLEEMIEKIKSETIIKINTWG